MHMFADKSATQWSELELHGNVFKHYDVLVIILLLQFLIDSVKTVS